MAVLSWKQRAALVKRYTRIRGQAAVRFLAVTQPESSGNTKAYNGTCCWGLWQIHAQAHANKFTGPPQRLWDPVVNVKVAEKVYREAGNSMSPWTGRPSASDLRNAARALNPSYSEAQLTQLISSIPGDPPGDWPTPTDPFGPFSDGFPDVPLLGPSVDVFNAIKNALGWITEPHNWLRMSTFLGGLIILTVGAYALLNNTKTGQQVTDLVIAAATRGKGKGGKSLG